MATNEARRLQLKTLWRCDSGDFMAEYRRVVGESPDGPGLSLGARDVEEVGRRRGHDEVGLEAADLVHAHLLGARDDLGGRRGRLERAVAAGDRGGHAHEPVACAEREDELR